MKRRTIKFQSNRTIRSRIIAALGLSICWHASVHAAEWDPSATAGVQGGPGVWNTTTTNWTNDAGVTNVVWDNTAAIFGVAGGAVSLGVPVSAASIAFSLTGYTLAGSPLTLTGTGDITVSPGFDATISSVISGSAPSGSIGLTKLGTGKLTMAGANNFTGEAQISAGTVLVHNNGAFGSGSTGFAQPYQHATTVTAGAGLDFDGGITVAGEALVAGGAGFGNLGALHNIMGDNGWTGPITLSGSLRVASDSGTLTIGGEPGAEINTKPGATARSLIMNGAGNLVVSGSITGTGGTVLVDNFGSVPSPGLVTLNGANTYTGVTTVSGGGNLTMAGIRTVASGNIVISDGTLNMTGARTADSGTILIGNEAGKTGTMNFSTDLGDFTTVSGGNIQLGELTGTGVVNHTSGILRTSLSGNTLVLVGSGANSSGTYNLSGGELYARANNNNAFILGTNSGATGAFNLSGTGVVTSNAGASAWLQIGRCNSNTTSSIGTFTQSGGTTLVRNIAMGGGSANNVGTISKLEITGGSFTVNLAFTRLSAGVDSSSQIIIGGTAEVTLPEFPITRGSGSTATLIFDGGILRPRLTSLNFINALDSAKIKVGGITIAVAVGNDIVIPQPLLTDEVSTGGGLTKDDVGELVLTGANTYTGPTTVTAGTLGISGAGSLAAASTVTVASAGILGGDGTIGGTVNSTGTIAPGTVAVGILTTGPANLTGGTLAIKVSGATADKLVSTGILSLSGVTLSVSELSAGTAFPYVIAEGGTLSGNFLSYPPGYSVSYNATQAILSKSAIGNYSTWASANGIPGEPASGDFDFDGLSNLVEYGLGLDPTVSSVPAGALVGNVITYIKGSDAIFNGDVSWVIQRSTSLNNDWTDAVTQMSGDPAATISFDLSSAPGGPRVFARLKVIQLP